MNSFPVRQLAPMTRFSSALLALSLIGIIWCKICSEDVWVNLLVLSSVDVALLPDALNHLTGHPAWNLATMVTGAVNTESIHCHRQPHPLLCRVRVNYRKKEETKKFESVTDAAHEMRLVWVWVKVEAGSPVWASSGEVGGVRVTEEMAGSRFEAGTWWPFE